MPKSFYVGLRIVAGLILGSALSVTAFAQQTLKIGAAISLTGNFSREGGLLKNGYELWKDDVNAAGGLKVGGKSYHVEIVYYDDESKAQTSARLTEKLISEEKVAFLFGPYSSGIATATAAISERYKVLTIAPMATANSVYARGYKFIFTPSPLAHTGLFPLIELAAQQTPKPSTMAIVGPDDLFPNLTADGAATRATELGFKVVYQGKYPKGAADLSAVVTALKSANADVVLASGYTQDSILLIKSMKELQVAPKMIGLATAIGIPDLRASLGASAEGLTGVDYWAANLTYKGLYYADSAAYAKKFKDKFGVEPTFHAASGTAAGIILQMAIEKAGVLDGEAVRNALAGLTGQTFYGNFKFSDNGVNVAASLVASQIQGGTPVTVFPKAVAQKPVIYPKPNL
jgi:branched-chain amino acid transport system substrate-binding protein